MKEKQATPAPIPSPQSPTAVQDAQAAIQDVLMDPGAAAAYLGRTKPLAVATLADLRCLGVGPDWVKIGASVRYKRSALDRYIAARCHQGS